MPSSEDRRERRDDTALRATDTAQRADDTTAREADTAQRAEDTAERAAIAVQAADRADLAASTAEVTHRDVIDLIDKAQRRARWKSLITLGLVVVFLFLGLWRGEKADRRIDRNSRNIEAVFRSQCEALHEGFTKVNAATEDIATVFEGAKGQTAPENQEALQRLIDDYRAKVLPVPDCHEPPGDLRQ